MTDRIAPIAPPGGSWLHSARHRRWLEAQGQRLLDFSRESRVEDGFAALDDSGRLADGTTADTIVTARMTHTYALAALQGVPGAAPLVAHGVAALSGPLRDGAYDGWVAEAGARDGRKQAYVHAFVALAASSAVVAGAAGAIALLDAAVAVIERHFWSEDEGVMRESFAADWSDEEAYCGANSNMHSLEMCMGLADVRGEPVWRARGLRIAERFVHDHARANRYRLPEHFDRDWRLLRDYHHDQPDHDLRPYGLTPGHFAEWSHLLLKLEAALLANGETAPSWLLEDAIGLFDAAFAAGWAADEAPGLVYTIDWDDKPLVTNRVHWAQAEAVTAAAALLRRTGRATYEDRYRRLWDYVDLVLVDHRGGSWHNEVDAGGRPSTRIYAGKPDLYHAYQATLSPLLPLAPSIATLLGSRD